MIFGVSEGEISSSDEEGLFYSPQSPAMSSGHENIQPSNENYPMTDEQQEGSTRPQEQQSEQPNQGVASVTDIPLQYTKL